jgi:hypothetical protein
MIKADIIREIEGLERKDQARYYVQLGDVLWESDQKEANIWLSKGTELASNQTVEYENNNKKLSALWNSLINVLEKDKVKSDKIISEIRKMASEKFDNPKDANETFILIADQILSRINDENTAFEFAMISLKSEKPVIVWHSSEFFRLLNHINQNLADKYFNEMIKVAKLKENSHLVSVLAYIADKRLLGNVPFKQLSEPTEKNLLEFLLPFIQNNALELKNKKKNDCYPILNYGIRFLEGYKRLLPEKSLIVEDAINVCQNADIESWKKPDFAKRNRKTSQDYLDLAKEITDKRIKTNYLHSASSLASKEGNHKLGISILDSIDTEFRDESWVNSKIDLLSNLVKELYSKNDFPEITKIINDTPEDYRPYIIVHSLQSFSFQNQNQKELVSTLLRQAKIDFNKIDKFTENKLKAFHSPTQFGNLVKYYVKLGLYEEAIATHKECVKSLNRLMTNLPSELKEKRIYRMSSYSRFTNQSPPNDLEFIDRYFDQIYRNISLIEDKNIRLGERLGFLKKSLEKPPKIQYIPGIPINMPKTTK